jgi:hypothetical protein
MNCLILQGDAGGNLRQRLVQRQLANPRTRHGSMLVVISHCPVSLVRLQLQLHLLVLVLLFGTPLDRSLGVDRTSVPTIFITNPDRWAMSHFVEKEFPVPSQGTGTPSPWTTQPAEGGESCRNVQAPSAREVYIGLFR